MVGFFVAIGLLGIGCSDQPLPTEVKSPVSVRLNASVGDGPTIATNAEDYAPGETVLITGWSWEPGETVRLQVVHVEDTGDGDLPSHQPWDVVADANGNVSSTWLVGEDESGASFKLLADGQTSAGHAEVTFSDLTGTPVVRMFVDAGRTTTQSAYPWGATIYPRVTTGATQINTCYRVRWFNPANTAVQTTIVGKGSLSYDIATFTIPATGPSGTWYAILDQNNGALDCNTATYSGAGDPVNFDVARAVVIGAGTTASDATGGDRCIGSTSNPTGCSATLSPLWVSSQASNIVRTFVRFDLSAATPTIPAGAVIDNAKVRLAMSATPSSSRRYDMQRASATWDEGSITWATQPGVTGSISRTTFGTGITPGAGGGSPQTWVKWTVTSDVQLFLDNPTINHGWRLVDSAETVGNVNGRFHSTEVTGACDTEATSCKRVMPVLLVDYSDPPKLEFYTTAKTGVVGQCLGPIQVQSKDFSGSVLPVSSNLTVNLSTANLGTGDVFGTAGAGAFYTNSSCTTSTTTTTINSGESVSDAFYYRATHRGDGGHDILASATNYTPNPSQTQTINKAVTNIIYDGDLIVVPGSTFTARAVLSSTYDKCAADGNTTPYGRRVLFVFDLDPTDGIGTLSSGFKFTNSSGVATATWGTTSWIEGMYDLTVNAVDNDDCTAQKVVPDPVIAVLSPGNAATGGGFLAGSKVDGGRANFGFNVRPIEGSDPVAYKGQFLLIRQDGGVPSFRCKGPITFYGVVSGSSPLQNFATGTCDFQVWNAALNGGEGGWEVPAGSYTNLPFTIEFIDNGSGKGKLAPPPDEFGFSISFPAGPDDPGFVRATLNGGNIDVKTGGSTTTTSTGGGTTGGGKKK